MNRWQLSLLFNISLVFCESRSESFVSDCSFHLLFFSSLLILFLAVTKSANFIPVNFTIYFFHFDRFHNFATLSLNSIIILFADKRWCRYLWLTFTFFRLVFLYFIRFLFLLFCCYITARMDEYDWRGKSMQIEFIVLVNYVLWFHLNCQPSMWQCSLKWQKSVRTEMTLRRNGQISEYPKNKNNNEQTNRKSKKMKKKNSGHRS